MTKEILSLIRGLVYKVEYMIGSLFTIIAIFILNRTLSKEIGQAQNLGKVRYSQSHIYSMVSDALSFYVGPPDIPTQTNNYLKNTYVKVMVLENEAYWIKDNKLYIAQVNNGDVDKNTVKEVDTMSMSKVELEKTMFIVEQLREGKDDLGSSGEPKF